jgi:hypothetical protein
MDGITRIHRAHLYNKPEFRSFDAFVEEWLVQADMPNVDPVFRLQSTYINDRGTPLLEHVGRFECLEETNAWIDEAIGRHLTVPHVNKSSFETTYREHFSLRLRDLVGKVYESDIRNFGYDF